MDLSHNLYAHALGMVHPYLYFEYRDESLPDGFNSDEAQGFYGEEQTSGINRPTGNGLPPEGGGHRFYDYSGTGFFDDLKSFGKKVYGILKPALQEGAKQGVSLAAQYARNKYGGQGRPRAMHPMD
jgi:hypothetical protein